MVANGAMRAPLRLTVAEAAEAWLAAARDGVTRTRSGDAYKPSAIRGYEYSGSASCPTWAPCGSPTSSGATSKPS